MTETLDFDAVRQIALTLSGVKESSIHGEPSLKLGGKLFSCPAIHKSAEAGSILLRVGAEMRAGLIENEPAIFYLTDHYEKYDMVLVRLSAMSLPELDALIRQAWQFANNKNT